MRIPFLSLFLMVFIYSCGSPSADSTYLPDKQSLAIEVRNQTFAQLKVEKELIPCGTGSGMMDQIRMLAMSFNYYKEIDMLQARQLLIDAGTVFLKNINANEQIRPFLQNYPFKPENIQIRIFLYNPNGKEPDFGKLTVISLIDGELRYKIDNPETNSFRVIYRETFDQAQAKLGSLAGLRPIQNEGAL
jgi:hypothetical protein